MDLNHRPHAYQATVNRVRFRQLAGVSRRRTTICWMLDAVRRLDVGLNGRTNGRTVCPPPCEQSSGVRGVEPGLPRLHSAPVRVPGMLTNLSRPAESASSCGEHRHRIQPRTGKRYRRHGQVSGALRRNGPAATTDRTVSYSIGAARFAVEAKPRPSSRRSLRDHSRPPAVEPQARH